MPKSRTYMGFQLDKKGNFNGKPLEHWVAKADELVMQCLVSAMNVDTRGIVGAIAHERIRHLAKGVNPVMFEKVIMDIEVMKANMGRILAAITMTEPGRHYCAKHAPKPAKRRRRKVQKENRVDPLD